MDYKFNLIRDTPDERDYKFEDFLKTSLPNPTWVDLRKDAKCPAILDQLQLGSCTANGASNALRFLLRKDKLEEFQPSRLFIYYFTRSLHNTINFDSGASIRNTIKAVKQFGTCSEKELPYDIANFKNPPPSDLVESAKKHIDAFSYYYVRNDTDSIKTAVASGYPIIFGFQVFSSFRNRDVTKTGIVPMPKAGEYCLGGHCVMIVGYRDSLQSFICMNSWGVGWGDKGYLYMPYEYIKQFAFDFWVLDKFA